jgi:hypothetical protein
MICAYCDREMLEHVSCQPDIGVEGQALERIAFGEENWWSEGEVATECHGQLLSFEHGPLV